MALLIPSKAVLLGQVLKTQSEKTHSRENSPVPPVPRCGFLSVRPRQVGMWALLGCLQGQGARFPQGELMLVVHSSAFVVVPDFESKYSFLSPFEADFLCVSLCVCWGGGWREGDMLPFSSLKAQKDRYWVGVGNRDSRLWLKDARWPTRCCRHHEGGL